MPKLLTAKVEPIAALALSLALAGCGGGSSPGEQPANVAPSIAAIANRAMNQDTTDAGLSFNVADADGDPAAVSVTVASSDTQLMPTAGLVLGGSGSARSLTITPAESAAGTARITISARDAQGLVASQTFDLTVNRVYASFTGFTNSTFGAPADESPRSLVGFTLDGDADASDAPFESLLQ